MFATCLTLTKIKQINNPVKCTQQESVKISLNATQEASIFVKSRKLKNTVRNGRLSMHKLQTHTHIKKHTQIKLVHFKYRYGTSGFRGNYDTLSSVMVRMGLLATLRSFCKGGKAVGIMITASHNEESDNGVKIIDPSGEMLESMWESIATDIANLDENV